MTFDSVEVSYTVDVSFVFNGGSRQEQRDFVDRNIGDDFTQWLEQIVKTEAERAVPGAAGVVHVEEV